MMAKQDDVKRDILLIVATILFFSFATGVGVDEEEINVGDEPIIVD